MFRVLHITVTHHWKHRIYLPLSVLSLLLSFPRQAVITPLTHTSDAKYTHLHLQEMCSNELAVRKRECAVGVAAGWSICIETLNYRMCTCRMGSTF